MSSAPRPEWTRTPPGIPYDCVARVCGSTAGSGAQQDLVLSRTGVSVLRPGGDQYELGYVYGPESSNADLLSRSLMPLLRKWTDGYNVTLMALGATGSGKTFSLEGGRAQDAGRGSSQGDGLVHLTADACFRLLQHKAAAVGEAAAAKRRGPVNRAFDFFLESSFVELYSETCHDLYAQGAARQSSLAVYEDEMEGFTVSGLTYRPARSEVELRAAFNAGRAARDVRRDDLGDVSDRCAALFTLHLAQSTPAATAGEEDRVLVSRLQFVELPGAERLAVEPEVLRLREGPGLNKGLTAWAHCIRSAAESRSAAELSPVEGSLLTRLLADALGGNALVLLLGCLRPGDWAVSRLTCELLATAQRVRTCPIINHGRARACLLKLRCRLLAVADERQALREQLAELPAEGDPNAVALSLARVRDVEARVLAEREEKARLVEEVAALQARLARLHEAGQAEEGSQAELQEALIKSEELRLGLAQTLIDTQ
ncbi:P-loop containing nucleoside triphosphate hydrolase protein, partial [Haematococcus lacustris]